MKQPTLYEIARACAGELTSGAADLAVTAVSTDSRATGPGHLFVALVGETHDGHDYADAAAQAGAIAAMVSKPLDLTIPQILVPDTLIAYGQLGAHRRQQSGATFLAITGSAGKTTTKDMLGAIVSTDGPSLVTPGTENNEIGVPRLLLELADVHRYCVLELAMRGTGEIAYLAEICRPDVGVITNIGEAHLGRLGSREAIAKAKAEILRRLPAEGRAVLNADDFFFGLHREMSPCPVISFGFGDRPDEVDAHISASSVKASGVAPVRFGLLLPDTTVHVELCVPGQHNVANALAAAAAAHAAGIGPEAIRLGLESYQGSPMRSQVHRTPSGAVVIDDVYNASPTSTPEALKLLGGTSGRKIFVFADMLELGSESERAHRNIGRLAAELGVDWLITIGEHAHFAADEAQLAGVQVNQVQDCDQAVQLLRPVLEAEDTVLVKASRGMALERVVEGLLCCE